MIIEILGFPTETFFYFQPSPSQLMIILSSFLAFSLISLFLSHTTSNPTENLNDSNFKMYIQLLVSTFTIITLVGPLHYSPRLLPSLPASTLLSFVVGF